MLVGTGGFEPPSMFALPGSPPRVLLSGAPRLPDGVWWWGAGGGREKILVGRGGFEPPSMFALPGSPLASFCSARLGCAAALQVGVLAVGERKYWSGRA